MSKEASSDPNQPGEVDEELDQILDNALGYFDKPPTAPIQEEAKKEPSDENFETLWNEEFLQNAQKQFKEQMDALFSTEDGVEMTPERFTEHFMKMAEVTQRTLLTESPSGSDFQETIAKTLKDLESSVGNLEDMDQMQEMLSGMNLGNLDPSDSLTPLLKPIIKDMFYPLIKEIIEKFPDWIESHKGNLSEEEQNTHKKQLTILQSLVQEMDKEKPEDSEDVKNERFKGVLKKIKELESLGNLPTDLIDSSNLLDGNDALPSLPGMDPSQCCLM